MSLRRSLPALRSIVNPPSLVGARRVPPGRLARDRLVISGETRGGRDGRVLLPTAEAAQGSGVRYFGLMDAVQDKIIQRGARKEEDKFKVQMRDLAMMDKFDLDDFAKVIGAPLDTMSAKMPWNKNREEVQSMKLWKTILETLTPAQRKNPEMIRERHRHPIADRAGCTSEEFASMLGSYREMKAMQAWLSTRRKRKEKIPTSQEEMGVMASNPSGTTLVKFMRVKTGRSGRPTFRF